MHKTPLYLIPAALLLLTACNAVVLDSGQIGSLSLTLSSDVEVEAETKADGDAAAESGSGIAFDCSAFLVNVTGTTLGGAAYDEDYVYGEMEETVPIPYGTYDVSAQSCTEAAAIDGFGCARYYGSTEDVVINSTTTVLATVVCSMVNAKASLILDESFLQDFTDISASLSVGERTVSLTDGQAVESTQVYFNVPAEGGNLVYTIKATIAKGTDYQRELTYTNSSAPMKLSPAKWAKITIRSNHNGLIGPDINIDDDMDESSSEQIIDPEGGVKEGEGGMTLPTIIVNSQIDDATVIDCPITIN